jgi:hypothetical protein
MRVHDGDISYLLTERFEANERGVNLILPKWVGSRARTGRAGR